MLNESERVKGHKERLMERKSKFEEPLKYQYILVQGEPLTYDTNFKGPLSKRSCTDVLCLILFAVFLILWAFVAYFAIRNGDLQKLLVPVDSNGQRCGVDSTVLDKPYLFFFNLDKCISPLVPITGCNTPQVCVSKCPQQMFIFKNFQGSLGQLKEKLICQTEAILNSIQSISDANEAVEQDRCASWYIPSTPLLQRCVWEFSTSSSSVCEYIPSFLLERRFKREQPNNDALPSFMQYSITAETPSAFSPTTSFDNNQLEIYDQKKVADEPIVQCENRKRLGGEIIIKKMKRTDTYFARFIGNLVMHFYNGTDAQQFGQLLVEDITESWGAIALGLLVAMILSLIFIALMRWIAKPMVWISIIGVLALLAYGVYYTVTQYIYFKDHPAYKGVSPNLAALFKSWLEDKTTWLVLSIILCIIFVILLLVVIFLRKRISIAIALIKEGSKAVSSIISTVFFPILPWVLQVSTIIFAICVGLYLASVGDSAYRVVGAIPNKCVCSGAAAAYAEGSSCDPQIFNDNCQMPAQTVSSSILRLLNRNTAPCTDAGCYFQRINNPNIIGYMQAYNVIGFFWFIFFISAFGEMVLAATFATWYWTFHKSDVPFFTLSRSFGRTIRYHLGTLALGSLIITICRIIRCILEYIDQKLKKFDNPCTRAILCCMKCFFWCLEKFLKFINKNAYIMCAIHGKNFCTSAKDAFNLLMRNFLRVVAVDKVTEFLFFLSKILITLGLGAATYFYVATYANNQEVHYRIVPAGIVMIGTYLITSVFFGVYSMAVDTLFLCFLEDCERNDGSAEKPYYMSKQLMKILGKKNEIPRSRYR